MLIQMCSGLAPIILIALTSAHLSALLLAKERHINTLTQIIPAAVLILFLYFWPISDSNTTLFIAGMLVGSLLRVLTLGYFCKKENFKISPKIDDISGVIQHLKSALGLMVLSQLVASFGPPIALYFAASLGEGSVSIFGYSLKIIALAVGLGATATGRAVLPVLSSSSQSVSDKRKLAIQWALKLFLVGFFSAAILWIVAIDLVKITFERGAFSSTDTVAVAEMIQYGAIQLPFVFCNVVLAQFVASQGAYRILFYSSGLGLTVNVISCFILIQFFFLPGLMLAKAAAVIVVNLFFFYRILRFQCNEK